MQWGIAATWFEWPALLVTGPVDRAQMTGSQDRSAMRAGALASSRRIQ